MSKSGKAMAKIKKNNSGFTIIELVVAISILGIIAATVSYMMVSSSKSYSSLSTEANLQSEAQLVANAISELAIDSYDATMTSSSGAVTDYDTTDGKVLELTSTVGGTKKQYMILKKSTDDELYLFEREYDVANSNWHDWGEGSLLGSHVSDFTVDDSRVASDNILVFNINYTKNNRTYKGNYQVLMRNKAYADSVSNNSLETVNSQLVLGLNPKIIYLDVVAGQIPTYYINTVSNDTDFAAISGGVVLGVPFTATATTVGGSSNGNVKWELQNADTNIFSLSEGEEAATNTLMWDPSKSDALIASRNDRFSLAISKIITDPITGQSVSALPKSAQILIRRVRSVSLNATSGVTGWIDQYTDLYDGQKSDETALYAYMDTTGNYADVHLSASILYSNIDYGGGLDWKLEIKEDSSKAWEVCENASYGKLAAAYTPRGTTNTVQLGPSAQNGQLYRVTATSRFDNTVESNSFTFGIAPSGSASNAGFNSRGFYVDLTAYLKKQSTHANLSIADIKIDEVTGALNKDAIHLMKMNGEWYMRVGYDAYATGTGQRVKFFNGKDAEMENGEEKEAENTIKLKIKKNVAGDANATADAPDIIYVVKPVLVSKNGPYGEVIVIRKGTSKDISIRTDYYNLVGRDYLGVYINDVNVNKSGMSEANKYFKADITSGYGDERNYVDRAVLHLNAKAAEKDYSPDPLTLRFTAEEYYIHSDKEENSYKDYFVFISNVEDSDVFIPTPDTTKSGLCVWPTDADKGKVDVSGYDANGNKIEKMAKVYKDGNRYKCEFRGSVYTYSKTYHYWTK